MADLSLVFDLLARDRASREFEHVGDAARKAGDGGSRFGSLMRSGIGMAAGALVGAGIVATFRGLYDAAAESEKVSNLTANAIRATGGAAGLTADQVGDLATRLSNMTGIDDEAVQGAENLLLTFTNIKDSAGAGNDVFSQTTALALDMSTALGTDASGAAMQLGKALNDPIRGVSALGRSGVSFTADQREMIKSLVESGNTLEAQKIILGEVGKEFGGAAEAAATPTDRLKVTVGNLQEQIGTGLIPIFEQAAGVATQVLGIIFGGDFTGGPLSEDSGVVDFLFRFRDAAIDAGHWITDVLWPGVQNFASTLWTYLGPALTSVGGFVTGTLVPALGSLFGFLTDNSGTVLAVAAVIGTLLVPALIAWGVQSTVAAARNALAWMTSTLSASAGAVSQVFSAGRVVASWVMMGARAIAQGAIVAAQWGMAALRTVASLTMMAAGFIAQGAVMLFQVGMTVAGVVAGWVVMGVQSLANAARMAAAWLIAMGPVGIIIAIIVGLVALIVANWDTVKQWTVAAWDAVVGAVRGAWDWITNAIGAAIDWIVNLFLNFTGPGLIIKHWDDIKQFTSDAWNAVVGFVSGAWNGIVDAISTGISKAIDFVTGLPGKIWDALSGLADMLWDLGADMIQGLIDGAGSLLTNIGVFFLDLLPGWIRGPFESVLGISSPSKVFADYGRNIGQGLIGGVRAMRPAVAAELAALADTHATTDLAALGAGGGGLGYRPPGYDLDTAAAAAGGGNTYVTTVSGVASPEQVAAVVDRAQRTTEFLAGAGS